MRPPLCLYPLSYPRCISSHLLFPTIEHLSFFALLRTIPLLPVPAGLRFGFSLERHAVALRDLRVIRAVRQMINLAVAVADNWPGCRRRGFPEWRFRGVAASPVIPR